MPGQSQGSGDSEAGSQTGGAAGSGAGIGSGNGGSENDRKRRRHRSPSPGDDELSIEYYTDSSSPDIIPFRQPTPKKKRVRKPKRNRLSRSQSPGSSSDKEGGGAVEQDDDNGGGNPKPNKTESYVREPTALLTIRTIAQEKAAVRRAERSANKNEPKSLATRPLRGKGIPKFNKPYLELLNKDIVDARTRNVYDFKGFSPLQASLIHNTPWTTKEKEAFFRALPRVGRDNVEALSKAVGSKSTIECAAYERELRKASEELIMKVKSRHKGWHQLITLAQIPAAFEVSDECVAALEEEAEKLENYRVGEELKNIKKENKWMGYDILNHDNASKLSPETENDDGGEKDGLPSAMELLNLEVFLKLSKEFYMDELPSIRHQAFADFYTLVVSLTRRLLHVTLFQAYTRLKIQPTISEEEKEVKINDVAAAVELLGITPTSEEFWRMFARRNNIQVRTRPRILDKNGKGTNARVRQKLSHRQVEKALQIYEEIRFEPPSESENETDDDDDLDDEEDSEEEDESHEPVDDMYNWKKYLKGCSLLDDIEEHRIIRESLQQAKEEDDYLEYIDKISSLRHEVDLWKLLGAPWGRIDKMEDDILDINEVPKPPLHLRYKMMEKEDWREEMWDKRLWEEDFYRKLWKQERYGEVQRVQPTARGRISEDSESEYNSGDDTVWLSEEEEEEEEAEEEQVGEYEEEEEANRWSGDEVARPSPRNEIELESEEDNNSPQVTRNEVESEEDALPLAQQEDEQQHDSDDDEEEVAPLSSAQKGVQLELILPSRRSKRVGSHRNSIPDGFVSTVNNVEGSAEEFVNNDDSDAAWWD